MGTNNKYGSITETLLGDSIINIQLNAKATPPSDLTLSTADFNSTIMYGASSTLRRGEFPLGDRPRIVGVGLWCNIGDGLVQIDNPADYTRGLALAFNINTYNNAVLQQTGILPAALILKVTELNQIFDTDYMLDTSAINFALTGQPTTLPITGVGQGSFRITATFPASSSMKFSMITVDPAFALKRLIIKPMLVVEHTYPFFTVGF